jgi:hypothetical protein
MRASTACSRLGRLLSRGSKAPWLAAQRTLSGTRKVHSPPGSLVVVGTFACVLVAACGILLGAGVRRNLSPHYVVGNGYSPDAMAHAVLPRVSPSSGERSLAVYRRENSRNSNRPVRANRLAPKQTTSKKTKKDSLCVPSYYCVSRAS